MSKDLSPINLKSNYYSIVFKRKIYKYGFQLLNVDNEELFINKKMVIQAIRTNKTLFTQKFTESYIFMNNTIFSPNSESPFKVKIDYDGNELELEISQVDIIETNDVEKKRNIIGKLVNTLKNKMNYKEINRKYFNPENKTVLKNGYEIWPGYMTSVYANQNKILLNIDLSFKVITNNNLIDIINQFKSEHRTNFIEKLKENLIGTSVMTKYNRRIYRIYDIDFDKSPNDKFTIRNKDKEESEICYKQYYEERYNEVIRDDSQPLLVFKEKNRDKEIYLIPELCYTTGMTKLDMANRAITSELAAITNLPPKERLAKCNSLNNDLYKKSKQFFEDWNIILEQTPENLPAFKIKGGDILMENKKINLDNNRNIDREFQSRMYTSRDLNTIGIFYSKFNTREMERFKADLNNSLKDFGIRYNKIKEIYIERDSNLDEWYDKIGTVNASFDVVFFILNGQKGKGKFYKEIKKYMIEKCPVPSQVILSKTISNGKNLRSIIAKIIIQINAKIGETPWAISLPDFASQPIIVAGIGFCKRKKNGVNSINICASINRELSKFYTNVSYYDKDGEATAIQNLCYTSINTFFHSNNKVFPKYYIVYTDSYRINKVPEEDSLVKGINNCIDAIKNKLPEDLKNKLNTKIIIVNVCKSSNVKFYSDDNNFNVNSGTLVTDNILNNNEFYLISTKCNKGVNSPSLYKIVYSNVTDIDEKELQKNVSVLSFKLCHLYYNTTTPTKLPSPIFYSNIYTKVMNEYNKEEIIPHEHYENVNGLYFI